MSKSLTKIIPCEAFWRAYIKKLVSFTVSLKVWLLSGSTILFLTHRITEASFVKILLGIAAARLVTQGVVEWSGRFKEVSAKELER